MQSLTLERPTTVPPTPAVLWDAMTESLQDEMSTEISLEDETDACRTIPPEPSHFVARTPSGPGLGDCPGTIREPPASGDP